jgi:glutaredoxin 3
MSDTSQKFEVWGQPNCPGCQSVKTLLDSKALEYDYMCIGVNGITKEDFFDRAPGARSVPQVFVGNTHIGGLRETQEYIKAL